MALDAGLLNKANFVLDSCGRQIPPRNQQWVDIPAHINYVRFMPGSTDVTYPGSNDIGGVMHAGGVSFFLRAMTAQVAPRDTVGVYWRLRYANGLYFQSALTSHAMAMGYGSDRQSFCPEVEWKSGEKLFVDLNTIIAGPPPTAGYTVTMMFEGVYRFPIPGSGMVSNPLTADPSRYFLNENQNILAPEFMSGPSCPTPQGYRDEEFCYVTPTADLMTNGSPVSNVTLQIQPDSDFYARQIWPYFPGGSNQGFGSVVFRMRRGDGYALMSNFCPINDLQGPMFKELKVKASDTLTWDAYVVDGGGGAGTVLTFGLYLYGVKRRRAVSS